MHLKCIMSMLRSSQDMIGYPVKATDGNVGKVTDFLFDLRHNALRYIVVDTAGIFGSNEVLVSPYLIGEPEFGAYTRSLPVMIDKERLEHCPPLDSDAPVSRAYERELANYYNFPAYWVGSALWGASAIPTTDFLEPSPKEVIENAEHLTEIVDDYLRSADEVLGYELYVDEGVAGKVVDLIFEYPNWGIRYLVVDLDKEFGGSRVLVGMDWVKNIDFLASTVLLSDVSRRQLEMSPRFDPTSPVNRDYEGVLHDYYGRARYWATDQVIC